MLSKLIAAALALPLAVGVAAPVVEPVETPAPTAPVVEPVETPAPTAPVVEPVETPAPTAPVVEPVETPIPTVPVVEPVETPVPAPPVVEPVETPATPTPQGLASTNDPQDPGGEEPTARASFPAKPAGAVDGWWNGPVAVRLSGVASAPASIDEVYWQLSGATTGSGSDVGSTTVTISAEGTTALEYFVTDSDGLASETKTLTFSIDSTAPTATMSGPLAGVDYWAGETFAAGFTCDDANVQTCYLEFLATGEQVNNGQVVTWTEGIQTVRVVVIDKAGNVTHLDREITVLPAVEEPDDTTAPVLTFGPTLPLSASGWSTSTANKLLITATDSSALTSVEYRRAIPGGGWTSWNFASNSRLSALPFPTGGEFYFEFRATDVAGNTSAPVETSWRADYEISAATVSGFPVTFDLDEEYELVYTCDDELSGVADCTSSNGVSGTPLPTDVAGNHSFTLTNTDVAGNTKTTTWNYTVVGPDVTKPQLTVGSLSGEPNAQGWFAGGWVEVHFTATDNDAVSQVWVEAVGAEPASGQFYTASEFSNDVRSEGVTTFTAYAVDAAGNQSAPVTFVVRLDRTAPAIDIVAPTTQAGSLVAATETFTKGQVVGLDYDCSDEHSGIASCETTEGVSFVPTATLGEQSIEFVAVDAAGNRTTQQLEYTVVAAPVGSGNPDGNPTQQPTTPAQLLASTGAEIWLGLLFVAALLAAGVTFLTVSRARR